MSENRNHQDDDLVARAVAAARQSPMPDGPSEAVISQTMAAIHNAANRPKSTLLRRIYQLPWKSKAAALLGIAASALLMYVAMAIPSSSSAVFAQAVDKIAASKTLSIDLSLKSPGAEGIAATGKAIYDEANNVRVEMHVTYMKQEDDLTAVVNLNVGKSLLLMPSQKTALTDLIKVGDEAFLKQTVFDRLKASLKEPSRPLGKKIVEGVEAEGLEIARGGTTSRFWVNPNTGLPVRFEMEGFPCPQPIGKVDLVLSNFKIDEKLDPSLFTGEAPEGYTVIKSPITIDLTGKPANNVVMILRVYAKQSGGRFPDKLLDLDDPIFKKMDTAGDPNEKATPENTEMGLLQGAAIPYLRLYLNAHKLGVDYQYYPGVSLGEKDRIVFWSRSTKTGEYTAAFGDLRVEKIGKEKIPPGENDAKK